MSILVERIRRSETRFSRDNQIKYKLRACRNILASNHFLEYIDCGVYRVIKLDHPNKLIAINKIYQDQITLLVYENQNMVRCEDIEL